jgi:subtilase family serine protease
MRRAGALLGLALSLALPALAAAEPVTTVRDNGDPANRVDIAILGDGYTAAELATYASHVESVVAGMFDQEPFREYRNFFNVHRVDVTSNESGADHPSWGVYRDTALGATYECSGVARALCPLTYSVSAVLARSLEPDRQDVVIVLVNDTHPGGSGGTYAVSSMHYQVINTVLHELGHSFGLLADEYGAEHGDGAWCTPGVEPPEPNVTAATSRDTIKWNYWIEPDMPIPSPGWVFGEPGLYEGAKYCSFGLHRPTNISKMRDATAPFEQINTEQLVKRIYNWVSPIESVEPAAATVALSAGEARTFRVQTPSPASHGLAVNWTVDGRPAGTGQELVLTAAGLGAGAHVVTVTIADPTPWVRRDPGGVLRESFRWDVTVAAEGQPNLQLASISHPPARIVPGGGFGVAATTANAGTGRAGASTTRFYLSADPAKGAGDRLLPEAYAVPELPPGASASATITLTVPAATPLGRYYLLGCADDTSAVAESSESDNCLAATATVEVTAANLVVASVANPPTSVVIGGGLPVSDTTRNAGSGPAPASTTRYYLSTDAAKSSGDRLLSGARSVPALAAGASSSGGLTVGVPLGTAAGTYYLLTCADDLAAVAETSEADNCRAAATTVQAVPGPNLQVSAVSSPPAGAVMGSTFSVTDTTRNAGPAGAGASVTRHYLSIDTSRGSGDIPLVPTRPVTSLPAGASSSGTVTVKVPGSIAAARYYLIACADDSKSVTEGLETDNCRASSGTVQVTGPNLVTSAVSNPPAGIAVGRGFAVTDTARNAGNATAGASTTRYWLSVDAAWSSGDRLLRGSRAVVALAPGATASGTATATVPAGTPTGSYYLLACADDGKVVTESNEKDNCRASTTKVSVTGPNLVESALANPPAAARIGGSFSVSDTARNAGNASAGASTTRYYLSTDAAKSSGDRLLTGGRSVPSLAAGATSSGSATVTVPTTTPAGGYYLLACADAGAVVPETSESDNCRASTTKVGVNP